ncbi:hypothetical protein T440DRAFT_468174, partial [Plenodomus tracheiphilus IPT5]
MLLPLRPPPLVAPRVASNRSSITAQPDAGWSSQSPCSLIGHAVFLIALRICLVLTALYAPSKKVSLTVGFGEDDRYPSNTIICTVPASDMDVKHSFVAHASIRPPPR